MLKIVFGCRLAREKFTQQDLNGAIVPWFILHKLFAGLYDVHVYTGNEKAKSVLIHLSDWAYNQFKGLDDEQWQKILACEHGGMLEVLVNVLSPVI